uniref:Uncharacterized protein n=1 Tax=Leptocylindrus danicus TaxID=163516 RepID=A0A7S2P2Y7_9STRA|mmetsp:Transcript_22437/g.33641  ORF Transcript_22437/g.33641 Transcript_22437/m.33641 type:complete len:155 (+) Transcript_22437:113-577(+)
MLKCMETKYDYNAKKCMHSTTDPNLIRLPSKYSECADPSDDAFYISLLESEAVMTGVLCKIVPRQVSRAYELYKLMSIINSSFYQDRPAGEDFMRRFRLMVKRRLVKTPECKEELGGVSDKKEKQEKLATIYDAEEAHYFNVLKQAKVQHHNGK